MIQIITITKTEKNNKNETNKNIYYNKILQL